MKQIREWLEGPGRDYAAGVALYEAHGRSGVLKRLVAGTCSDYTREVLVRELEKLTEPGLCNGYVTEGPKKAVETAVKTDSLCNGYVTTVPAEDEELRRYRRKLFAQRDYLHAPLEAVATDAERLVMAQQLLATVAAIQLSYDVAAGRAVAPAAAPDLAGLADAGEIRRLLANLKPLRSKLKKRPDRADDLARVEADINLLERKLKIDE